MTKSCTGLIPFTLRSGEEARGTASRDPATHAPETRVQTPQGTAWYDAPHGPVTRNCHARTNQTIGFSCVCPLVRRAITWGARNTALWSGLPSR
jgi:hypothetical protein